MGASSGATSPDQTQTATLIALRNAGLPTGSAGDYIQLLKPRVMSLVVLTALVGLVAAPVEINPLISFVAILCIAVGAGSSGVLNMWYDADIDRLMGRTAERPIPSGAVDASDALIFGVVLAVFSVLTLGLAVNWQSAAMLAFTIFFYVVIYTWWLKRWTPQNIVIGGAAGAFPPAIGWLAATGTLSWEPVLLVAIIFMWTPPHFWALALLKKDDYGRAGVPMLPNVAGNKETCRQILIYAAILAPLAVLPSFLGFSGVVYGIVATVGGVAFVRSARQLYMLCETDRWKKAAGKLFGYSIIYLFALFLTILAEDLVAEWFGVSWLVPEAVRFTVGA